MDKTFRSDNGAGMSPEALQALVDANDGHHHAAYGYDAYTERAVAALRDVFQTELDAFFVATGTAANCLAIAGLTEGWQTVLAHRHAHVVQDESTAPERFSGCRLRCASRHPSKVRPADIEAYVDHLRGDVHQASGGVVTISNPTEFGTVYMPDEVAALSRAAHQAEMALHVDGARFANAVASIGSARALTVDAGVDALSFGGTKNGLAMGEAAVFFGTSDRARAAARRLPHLRKVFGHLLSKHRFVSAPFAATLRDGHWLRHAERANAMARRLSDGLIALGIEPAFPVEANGVFVRLPADVDRALRSAGHQYYPFGDREQGLSRLMCSFDTSEVEVDALLATVRSARPRAKG